MKKKTLRNPRDKGLHHHLTFTVTAEDKDRLQKHAGGTETPVGAVLRRALRSYLEKLKG